MVIKKIIDLSQPVFHNCPGWPTYGMASVSYEAIYPKDGYTAERITLNAHTGTHIDAPFHFFPDGKTIDEFPVETFQGEAVAVNLFGIAAETAIGVDHLNKYEDKIKPGDIVLLCTGWGMKRGYSREYYFEYPYLSRQGAEWLLDKKVKAVGIDAMSVGGCRAESGVPPHEVLLGNDIWLLEELYITEELFESERWYLCAYPIKLRGFSGAPVRAVAMLIG